jgi:anion-transporting  ArsA/GET3 family ATPase
LRRTHLGTFVSARLTIFLGKGGVGRTTLAAAFAVDRAAAGERVLLVSVLAHDDPSSRIAHEAAGVRTEGRLDLLKLDPRALVDDIIRRITRLGPMAEVLLKHPSYDSLVEIVPGIREIAIFHLIEQKRHEGYQRIVLDAPATGHGIHFLEAPEKTARILAGPLRDRAEALRDMLKDPSSTDVVLVTLAEEMPVRETMELAAKLREQGFPLDNVAVNKWLPRLLADPASRKVLDALHAQPAVLGRERLAALELIAGQREEAASYVRELRALHPKLSLIPLVPDSERRLLVVAEAMRGTALEDA